MDLSTWDFDTNRPLALSGEWEFFWEELRPALSPQATSPDYVMLPDGGLWQNIKLDDEFLPNYGYASYRSVISFSGTQGELALKVPDMFSTCRIYLNGVDVFQAGTVGDSRSNTSSFYRTGIVRFTPRSGPNEFLIQVANYKERRGGINRSPVIGRGTAVESLYIESLAIDLLLCGSLLAIGLYHLCLYWIRRKDKSPLWFGLFCLIIALRSVIYGERFLFGLLHWMPWEVFNTLDHLSFYLGIPIFAEYLRSIFDKEISKPLFRIYQAMGIGFSLCLFLPPEVFNTTVIAYEVLTAGYVIYILVAIFRALSFKRQGSVTSVVGIFLFLGFGINEILHNLGVITTFNSLSLGLAVFLFTQSILLAMRFSKAFKDSEYLGESLMTTNSSLRRFIPQEFFHLLQRQEVDEIRLGDQVQQSMSIMFSDIRGFTALAEQMGAAKTFDFLNDYFGRIGHEIRANRGFVDKYLGDGFIALFPGDPDDAMQTAVSVQRVVAAFNTEREKAGLSPIAVGSGLNFGPLILGTVGETHRMDTTVIADSVNLCSRLEGLTKLYGKGTIVPMEFMDRLSHPEDYHWRYVGRVRVQGRKEPVEIVHVYDGVDTSSFATYEASKSDFEEALSQFRNGALSKALELFKTLKTRFPADPAPASYVAQIQRLVQTGQSENWDGVDEAGSK